MRVWFLALFLLFPAMSAWAEIYNYHPSARLYLGGGYNPFNPNAGYLRCVESDGDEAVDTEGAIASEVAISLLRSREDFYNMISFSASLAGSYMFMSGGGSVEGLDERAFHADSLTWIIMFKTDYGRFVLNNPRLKEKYREVSDDELYRTCGSEVVTEQRKGVLVYALLTVSNLNESQKHEFENKFSASAGGQIWSASMDSQYKSILRTAMAVTYIKISVRAIGGRGIVDLAPLLDQSGQDSYIAYEKIPSVMKEYITSMDRNNSVPTQFVTTHIGAFRSNMETRFHSFKSTQVAHLYSKYQDISSVVSRLSKILMGQESSAYDLTDRETQALRTSLKAYEDGLNKVYANARSCFLEDGAACHLPSLILPYVQWPDSQLINRRCEADRQHAVNQSLIGMDFYYMAKARNFRPVFVYRGSKVEIEGWEPCQ